MRHELHHLHSIRKSEQGHPNLFGVVAIAADGREALTEVQIYRVGMSLDEIATYTRDAAAGASRIRQHLQKDARPKRAWRRELKSLKGELRISVEIGSMVGQQAAELCDLALGALKDNADLPISLICPEPLGDGTRPNYAKASFESDGRKFFVEVAGEKRRSSLRLWRRQASRQVRKRERASSRHSPPCFPSPREMPQ